MNILNFYLFILLYLMSTISCFALDYHPIIGINSIYTNINDPNLKYSDKWNPIDNITSINTGLSLNHDNIMLGFTTNRLFNRAVERNVKSKKTGREYQNKTKTDVDSIFLGYQIRRWQPALFLANANVEKSLYQNDTLLNRTKQSSILYGVSLGYSLTRHIQASVVYIVPNQEQYLESGFGIGLNYIF